MVHLHSAEVLQRRRLRAATRGFLPRRPELSQVEVRPDLKNRVAIMAKSLTVREGLNALWSRAFHYARQAALAVRDNISTKEFEDALRSIARPTAPSTLGVLRR